MTERTNLMPQPPRPRRRWLFASTLALGAALTGAAASQALSYGPGPWRGPGFMGPLDPVQIENGADRAMRHLAIEVDATTEQQEKLRAIAKGAVRDLVPMREKAVSARERARGLLTQPNVDRAAIEAFRAEQMALADAASKRVAQVLGDAAEILTPEQRRKLDDLIQWRRSQWGLWHRG